MTDAPLRLLLVDEDPVFRLGLRIWLEQAARYQVVAEASRNADALAILNRRAALADDASWSELDTNRPVASSPAIGRPDLDLVILDLGLGAGDPDQLPGLQLCAEIKARFPTLPVLVLSTQSEPVLAAAARQMGADGFAPRGLPVADLGQLIDQLSRPQPRPAVTPARATPGSSPIRPQPRPPAPVLQDTAPAPTSPRPLPKPWAALRRNLRQSSIQQIEAMMAAIEAEQRRGRADVWTEALWAGRYRELKAARWLMANLLATPTLDHPQQSTASSRPPASPARPSGRPGVMSSASTDGLVQRSDRLNPGADLVPGEADRLAYPPGDVATLLLERVFSRLQGCLDNTSDIPLETDLLRDDKKRELLYLTLRKFEEALDHLRRDQVPPGQLAEQSPLVLRNVWESVLADFFGRYYTLPITNLEQPVVPTLMAEAEVVQRSILNRIPLVPMLLGYLLYQDAMVVDGSPYPANDPPALERSQALLEHLLIQVANGVIQPLLNCFADVELMKKNLYHRRLMTSRDIERFRNDLSWRYRWDGLVKEPTAMFESQYRLFGLTERGIQTKIIYAPRRDELDQLSGLQRLVTLTIEARDAIAPRFRSAVSLVGSGIVYVLTDVIGRGIGLIGRGILRGVGSAWRDPRDQDSRSRRYPADDHPQE